MKICIAQALALKGEVRQNINNHLRIIERAAKFNADLIVFPELSITSYEPSLAKVLACDFDAEIFSPFQLLADKYDMSVGIGMPIKVLDGINISMLIFQPLKERLVYAKQLLHADELPYFKSGKRPGIVTIKGKKIGLGICYETLQNEHFINTFKQEVDVFIASVAKPKNGIQKAFQHFPKMAIEYKVPILMANSVGFCDNFLSLGQSATWNKNGELINQLDCENEGILLYDTDLETTETYQLKITLGQLCDLDAIFQVYLNAKQKLERNGLFQWTSNYPTISIIKSDLKKGFLYSLKYGDEILGAINISEEQETVYHTVNWLFDHAKVLVIHRLVVDPKHQGQGFAKKMMDFAETFARDNNYTSIRLDAYSQNKKVLEFYKKRNYKIRGDVNFPEREYPFHCMEKKL